MQRTRRFWVLGSAALIVAAGAAGTIVATIRGGDHSPERADTSMNRTVMNGTAAGMGGHDMGPVDTSGAIAASADARGGRPLKADRIAGEKIYRLTASEIRWTIARGVEVGALAYNAQVPGPLLRARVGDRLRVVVKNDMPEPTSVHWHGLVLPNGMDGAGGVTQKNIMPGEAFTYRFRVRQAGTFFYHSHTLGDRQVALGLSGALIVDGGPSEPVAADVPMMLGEWTIGTSGNVPAMEFADGLPNWFTINGKSWPETERIRLEVGQSVRIRFIGSGQFIHPMHIHGGSFRIVATDGNPVPTGAQLSKDTVLVGPGERYDVIWTARERGTWLIHCHILHHTTNDGREVDGGGGLTTAIDVA